MNTSVVLLLPENPTVPASSGYTVMIKPKKKKKKKKQNQTQSEPERYTSSIDDGQSPVKIEIYRRLFFLV